MGSEMCIRDRIEPLKQKIQTKCEERAVNDRSTRTYKDKSASQISLIEAVLFFKLKKIKN